MSAQLLSSAPSKSRFNCRYFTGAGAGVELAGKKVTLLALTIIFFFNQPLKQQWKIVQITKEAEIISAVRSESELFALLDQQIVCWRKQREYCQEGDRLANEEIVHLKQQKAEYKKKVETAGEYFGMREVGKYQFLGTGHVFSERLGSSLA